MKLKKFVDILSASNYIQVYVDETEQYYPLAWISQEDYYVRDFTLVNGRLYIRLSKDEIYKNKYEKGVKENDSTCGR